MAKENRGKLLREFKEFAMRGSVIDLAVGVVIGGAFNKITSSLVNDLIMPFVGMFLGGVNFAELAITLPNWYNAETPNVLMIGNFISTIIDFVIIAFVVFLIVKLINRLRRLQLKKDAEAAAEAVAEAAPPEPTKEELLLTEIRDLLREKR